MRTHHLKIAELCQRQGIGTAFQLWEHLKGSKQSVYQLWNGETKMIRLETIDKLCDLLGVGVADLFDLRENGKRKKEKPKQA